MTTPPPKPPSLSRAQRERFDALFEEVLESLPDGLHGLIEQVPIIVDDVPSPDLIESMKRDGSWSDGDELNLCGLHSGIAFTEESVEHSGALPPDIHLFRIGIIEQAGGWDAPDAEEAIMDEIEITLLHEIGHQFGLSETDLERLGYQ